jgi:DNA repair protein RecN (Recombination protein N)
VDASPARLQEVEDRLVLLERLKRKYGPALADVIDKRERLARERDLLTGAGERADELQAALRTATETYLARARELSRKRRAVAGRFAREVEALLADLAMERARMDVRFNELELPSDAWSERGIDQAEFFLSPNPGEDLRPLARIISGGELSRVMLALKTLGVKKPGLISPQERSNPVSSRTLIFDEVDAGIGGRVADTVGARLRALGDHFQVLCITHLPQIAARASTQFRIEKTVRKERTVTTVARLNEQGRINEIARMIGGSNATEPVRASAEALLTCGRAETGAQRTEAKGKQKAKGESESAWRKST